MTSLASRSSVVLTSDEAAPDRKIREFAAAREGAVVGLLFFCEGVVLPAQHRGG